MSKLEHFNNIVATGTNVSIFAAAFTFAAGILHLVLKDVIENHKDRKREERARLREEGFKDGEKCARNENHWELEYLRKENEKLYEQALQTSKGTAE